MSGSYTTIIAGKFFEGSTLPVSTSDGASTDGAANSNITVTTSDTHGFSTGTKVYLRNTVGPKVLKIVETERLKLFRQINLYDFIKKLD